jgi:hypothetical protein
MTARQGSIGRCGRSLFSHPGWAQAPSSSMSCSREQACWPGLVLGDLGDGLAGDRVGDGGKTAREDSRAQGWIMAVSSAQWRV